MKKILILICSLALSVFTAAAEVNVSLNTSSGPLIEGCEFRTLAFPELGLSADYTFEISREDSISAGIDLVPIILPYAGLTFSYNHCMNIDSEKNYKWYVQYCLTLGTSFYGNDYVDEDGEVHNSWAIIPSGKTEIIFACKPDKTGFYFGAGPCISFGLPLTSSENVFEQFALIPGVSFKTGLKF